MRVHRLLCGFLLLGLIGCSSEDEGMITTPSGLKYKDRTVGEGVEAKLGDWVEVHYVGRFTDGTTFDSSLKGDPYKLQIGAKSVIDGWEEGLQGMKVKGQRKLYIPSHLAYGTKGRDPIPPDTDLVFDIALVKIHSAP